MTLEQLNEVAQELAKQPGVAGVFGKSMALRIRSYMALSRLGVTA